MRAGPRARDRARDREVPAPRIRARQGCVKLLWSSPLTSIATGRSMPSGYGRGTTGGPHACDNAFHERDRRHSSGYQFRRATRCGSGLTGPAELGGRWRQRDVRRWALRPSGIFDQAPRDPLRRTHHPRNGLGDAVARAHRGRQLLVGDRRGRADRRAPARLDRAAGRARRRTDRNRTARQPRPAPGAGGAGGGSDSRIRGLPAPAPARRRAISRDLHGHLGASPGPARAADRVDQAADPRRLDLLDQRRRLLAGGGRSGSGT